MAADVGYMVRAHNNSQSDQTTKLVTRDLLSKSFCTLSSDIDHSQELDLDSQVPVGWEKLLDLKSGQVYLQKCNPASVPNLTATSKPTESTKGPSIKRPLKIMEETSLDLKRETTNNNHIPCSYESVCTLDKVRSALDRAKNEQVRRMYFPRSSKSPSTSSSSTKVTLGLENEEVEDERTTDSKSQKQEEFLIAAVCPKCLMYVMISKENSKCPKCSSSVSMPVMKKPKIDLDLNISI